MRKVTWPPCRLPYPSSDSLVLGGRGALGSSIHVEGKETY